MHIDWATLAAVAIVAGGAALTVVLLVAFALVGLSLRSEQPSAPAQRSLMRTESAGTLPASGRRSHEFDH